MSREVIDSYQCGLCRFISIHSHVETSKFNSFASKFEFIWVENNSIIVKSPCVSITSSMKTMWVTIVVSSPLGDEYGRILRIFWKFEAMVPIPCVEYCLYLSSRYCRDTFNGAWGVVDFPDSCFIERLQINSSVRLSAPLVFSGDTPGRKLCRLGSPVMILASSVIVKSYHIRVFLLFLGEKMV